MRVKIGQNRPTCKYVYMLGTHAALHTWHSTAWKNEALGKQMNAVKELMHVALVS